MKLSSKKFSTQFAYYKNRHKTRMENLKKWYKIEISATNKNDEKRLNEIKENYEIKKNKIISHYELRTDALVRQRLLRRRETNKAMMALNRWRKIKLKNAKTEVEKEDIYKKYEENKLIIKRKSRYPWSKQELKRLDPYPHVDISNLNIATERQWKKNLKMVMYLTAGILLSTLALDVFIKPLHLYNGGLRGVTQTIYYAIDHYKNIDMAYSYLLFFAFNIPLFIFGWYKVGKKFTLLSLIVIVFQYLFSLVITESGIRPDLDIFQLKKITDPKVIKIVAPFLGGFVGGIMYGISIGFIYLAGGSTAGSKFFVTYWSEKKGLSLGHYARLIAIFVVLEGLIINKIIIEGASFFDTFISPVLSGTVIFIYMSNKSLDGIFGKTQKIKVDIISEKYREIIKFLEVEYRYERPFSRREVMGGSKKKQVQELTFVLPILEKREFIRIIRQIDPEAFITIAMLEDVKGHFYVRPFS